MQNVPAVAIRNLNFFYGAGDLRKQVLFDINLTIDPGQIVIVTGPSGSGKTTLLTLLGALRTATDGSLQVFGQELVGLSAQDLVAVRRNIGFIFQAHNLFASLTARQNVMLALDLHGATAARREQAANMLTALGLGERIDYLPQALSGGQKQRVAIARALVHRPQLVLADEPTAALDKKTGREVVERMQRLVKEKGTTILMVTHDNRILDIADRLIELVDGSIERDRPGVATAQNQEPFFML
ncbi:MAG: ATP-binding cassette domain-containing protein [Oscillatoriales cyanobacterium SM2_1_8]|nr:ATP-binding cassette domain-containing protein [Oscillatoriales cyanobacterium SM2_1_8]